DVLAIEDRVERHPRERLGKLVRFDSPEPMLFIETMSCPHVRARAEEHGVDALPSDVSEERFEKERGGPVLASTAVGANEHLSQCHGAAAVEQADRADDGAARSEEHT